MAEMIFNDAFLSVGGTDLSDHVRSVTLSYSAETQDSTAMSDTTRNRLGGLLDWSVTVEFNQDYAASKVDATLFSLVGTSVALILRPDSSAVGTTNPQYSGNAILESYQPMGGAVGDILIAPATFQGNGTLTRSTS